MQVDKGETVIVTATIRDWDTDDLVNPTNVTLDLFGPDGTQLVTAQDMTIESTGTWYYDYQITTDATEGKYDTKITATHTASSRVSIQFGWFYVRA